MKSPLVLVVEDDPDALALRVRQLETAGCRAIAVSNSDDAIRELWHAPLLGGVLTDINLVHAGDDKSGVALARYVRKYRPALPVSGYSGVFAEDRMSAEELALFDTFYGAGALTASDIRNAMNEVAELANRFAAVRRDEANARLETIRRANDLDADLFETFRRLVPDENLAMEQALAGAKLHAHIVGAGEISPALLDLPHADPGTIALRTPIVVWVREEEDGVEAEVHGAPELYAFGETADEAIRNAMTLSVEYFIELADASDLGGPLVRLRDFLVGVFERVHPHD